jgi:hypothetical protein
MKGKVNELNKWMKEKGKETHHIISTAINWYIGTRRAVF